MSSGNAAMYIAVSALRAQSANLSMISTNLANSSTVGYKEVTANFSTLVTDPYGSSELTSAGVLVNSVQSVDLQGLIESADISTYMAIDGNGFFVVSAGPDSNEFYYTRAGTFGPDDDGYLVNKNGYYLQGWPVDSDGNLLSSSSSAGSLETINLNSITGAAEATENIEIVANLPADAAVGDTFTTSSEIYDAVGTSHTLEYTWEKTGTNSWEVTVTSDDGTIAAGSNVYQFTFSDGALDTVTPATTDLTITGWSSGASDSTITFDFGTVGRSDGLSNFDSKEENPQVSVSSVSQDGLQYGEIASVSIDKSGLVTATFDNGMSRPIYQIPLATFNNPNGLTQISGNAFVATIDSGTATLNVAGYGGSGTIAGSSVEASTVTTSEELTDMIVAQQAYSAASQVISTSQDMFDALIQAV